MLLSFWSTGTGMQDATEDDRQAIMQLIEDESAAYWNRNYDAWAECWVQAPYIRKAGWWTQGGITYREGWRQIAERMQETRGLPAPGRPAGIRRENINLRVRQDMAWMTYDEYWPNAGTDLPGLSRETRVLEKHGGRWRIAYSCYLYRSLEHVVSALVRVDGHSAVQWLNPAAEKAIADGCGLAVWAGRLRATNRVADQRLRAGIRWAQNLDEGLEARRGTIPIVLEGGDGEPANVSWIIADSGLIHISINDARLAEERLESAAVVYGLSPAQVRLAEHIVAGNSLRDASEKLSVSLATTRTQLERIFDKTGVRSQPALVRALLSVAAPLA
jgi:DNA-binding CsgD family transcriptional regulator